MFNPLPFFRKAMIETFHLSFNFGGITNHTLKLISTGKVIYLKLDDYPMD